MTLTGQETDKDIENAMTLGEHLEELRARLIRALAGLAAVMVLCLLGGRWIIQALRGPYVAVMQAHGLEPRLVVGTHTFTDGIGMYLEVSFYSALVIAAPWVFYQLWLFVAAGLYPRERRYVMRAVPFSVILFMVGAGFFLGVVARPMISFIVGFTQWLGMEEMYTFHGYVRFMTRSMAVFGLAFQTPVVIYFLGSCGLVPVAAFDRYRRHVIVGTLIFAALMTSPSPVDQVLLAVPVWALYELGVLLVKLRNRRASVTDGGEG